MGFLRVAASSNFAVERFVYFTFKIRAQLLIDTASIPIGPNQLKARDALIFDRYNAILRTI